MSKYVIIGNSTAAIGCVEGIRSVDADGEIVLISSEKHHTYSRPLISYLLEGKTDEQRMKYRPDSFYTDNRVTAKLGVKAEKLDAEKKTVQLENGEVIPYEQLLVATGSTPFIPPMQGLETVEKAFTFMSLDDAKALENALTPESRVLIIGAGLIGLKCAEGIAERVKSITVVDMADRVLPSILDETGSGIVRAYLEKHGMTFYLNDTVSAFDGGHAVLRSGAAIDFDVLVIAVGVRPAVSLVKDAGGAVRRGIAADSTGRTTLPDVYAAGDCAESFDISAGVNRVLALLPNAYMQGHTAGVNMAGGRASFDNAIPMNAIGFMGLHIITAGAYDGETYTAKDGENYKILFYKDDLLKGYILIGDVARAGIYTALIRNRTPLSTIDFGLICEKPQLMAFTSNARRNLLSRKQ
ncbi:MAG: NAD(P)/FAD-dependent oxidoreductase [Hominenteromicrobium sp.]